MFTFYSHWEDRKGLPQGQGGLNYKWRMRSFHKCYKAKMLAIVLRNSITAARWPATWGWDDNNLHSFKIKNGLRLYNTMLLKKKKQRRENKRKMKKEDLNALEKTLTWWKGFIKSIFTGSAIKHNIVQKGSNMFCVQAAFLRVTPPPSQGIWGVESQSSK